MCLVTPLAKIRSASIITTVAKAMVANARVAFSRKSHDFLMTKKERKTLNAMRATNTIITIFGDDFQFCTESDSCILERQEPGGWGEVRG